MRFSTVRYLVITLLFFNLLSCKRSAPGIELKQGIIEYQIIYLKYQVGSYSPSVFPQTMTMKFNNSMSKNIIEGALGFFNLTTITDFDELTNITYLKFIDKKYVYVGKKKEYPCCFGHLNGIVIEFTDETKTIAGFECQKAIASFPGTDKTSFPVYYSTEFDIKRPNAINPFKEIPGILFEFETSLGNAKMKMIAQEYKAIRIPDKEFNSPGKYIPVSKKEIENILNALLE